MAVAPAVVDGPVAPVWRVARGDPLEARLGAGPDLLAGAASGNRFDSPLANYGVLYFGATLRVCFGEILAPFRPAAELSDLVESEWAERGFMDVGAIPAEWRGRRSAVQVRLSTALPYLDVEVPETHRFLESQLGLALDVSVVRGKKRGVTRQISQWAWAASDEDGAPVFAGIRYLSRLDSAWECWAVFDDTPIEVLETVEITADMPDLVSVAKAYNLRVH